LLAIACIVREPSRFHVTLPLLPDEQRLVKVPIPHSIPITRAADHAGLSVDILKQMNSAFRNDLVDPRQASYLMLPKGHAQQFQNALLQRRSSDSGNRQSSARQAQVHTVRKGECLSLLAQHYAVGVADLKRWNRLDGNTLKPGQKLKIELNR
jgi:membrane-bound lytic murein transglycosylase D